MNLKRSLAYHRRVFASILATLALGGAARATEILNLTTALTLTDPIQLGRLSRNAIPQDWAGTEPFPGVVETTTIYHYRTFVLEPSLISLGHFIQISLDHLGPHQGSLFVAAYSTSYVPNAVPGPNAGLDIHWLGDAGVSGNVGGAPVSFQVVAPLESPLLVVVSNGLLFFNEGIGNQFNLLVESFSDANYSPAGTAPGTPPSLTAVPEPSTYGFWGAVVVGSFSFLQRRQRRD